MSSEIYVPQLFRDWGNYTSWCKSYNNMIADVLHLYCVGIVGIALLKCRILAIPSYLLYCMALCPAVIPQCPKGWLKFQTNCYYFSADQQPWEMAMSSCLSLKAHLVVIDDKNDTDKQVSHSLDRVSCTFEVPSPPAMIPSSLALFLQEVRHNTVQTFTIARSSNFLLPSVS
uniref:C-type lectin domain-containing protein n=1 Tax=Laticauda laticaudata TaxID=8630 RepID=A0A8C5RYI4_LATLA